MVRSKEARHCRLRRHASKRGRRLHETDRRTIMRNAEAQRRLKNPTVTPFKIWRDNEVPVIGQAGHTVSKRHKYRLVIGCGFKKPRVC